MHDRPRDPAPLRLVKTGSGADLDDTTDEGLEGKLIKGAVAEDDGEDYDELPHPVIEHASYVAAGVVVVARNTWRARSTSTYDRMIDAAAAVGDHEKALEWEGRRALFQTDRHARRFDWIELPARVLAQLPKLALATGGGALGIGGLLALAEKDPSQIVAPIMWAAEAVHIIKVTVVYGWLPGLIAGVSAGGWALWRIGVQAAENGEFGWLASSADPDLDIEIDETTIARALGALRIPQITTHLKEGLPLQFLTTARRDGRGTHAVLRLPAGVTAEMIGTRRAQLASGLFRAAKETWPTTGSEAGVLDLWIADKGALAEGAGPYPLLEEGVVDYFKGVPYGKVLRGDPMVAPMAGRNTIVGGMPDQGKSSAARILMAGCALDPTAELRIWVPDTNYDFEVFKPRCSRYVMGAEDDKIEQILEDLRELYAEIQTRGELLVKYKQPEVTRELASAGVGLHPLINLLEEAHIAIQHKEHGEEISELLEQITKLGRKRAIHLIVSTQAPTKDSMPRGVTRNCSNGIAFAVSDHVANDALLGQGAYRGGHRATELIPGTDAGTALVKGFSGQRSDMVQAYFLSVKSENDQVTPLIQRSLAEIERRGKSVPGTHLVRTRAPRRIFIVDLDDALAEVEDRIKLTDVVSLLRKVAPDWEPYRKLSAKDVRPLIQAEGIHVITTGNVPSIEPGQVRTVAELWRQSLADQEEE